MTLSRTLGAISTTRRFGRLSGEWQIGGRGGLQFINSRIHLGDIALPIKLMNFSWGAEILTLYNRGFLTQDNRGLTAAVTVPQPRLTANLTQTR